MASLFRQCLDGHRCENGSSCAEHPAEEGKYYCDCDTSNGDFAGLFCEYEAETYCQMPQQTSSSWFCTNMGTCVLSTGGSSEAQWTCDCPEDFDGPVRQLWIWKKSRLSIGTRAGVNIESCLKLIYFTCFIHFFKI